MLVEGHASFRQAIAFILGWQAGIGVVAQAGNPYDARRLLTEQDVGVAVDFNLPDGSGTEFVEHLRNLSPRSVALILRRAYIPKPTPLPKSEAITGIVEAVGRLAAG